MNIDEYRALKAQEEQENNSKEGETPNAETQQGSDGEITPEQEKNVEVSGVVSEENKPEENGPTEQDAETKETKPTTIEVDGEELTLEELKNGYLRQSDYTRKTQEVRRLEQEAREALELVKQLREKPEVAQQLSQQFEMPNLDPIQAEYRELENKYYDLLIEKQVNELQAKYGEFDVIEVLETARDNNIKDLDTAYHVVQSRKGGGKSVEQEIDIDALKEELRQGILEELKKEQEAQADTSTIIKQRGSNTPVKSDEPNLTREELKVARMMGLDKKEYAKWRDIRKRK